MLVYESLEINFKPRNILFRNLDKLYPYEKLVRLLMSPTISLKTTKNSTMCTMYINTPRIINRQTSHSFVYTLYIDESGDPGRYDANDVTAQSSTKHFTLAGIIVQDRVISTINTHVQNLIQQYFKSIPLDDKFKLHCYPLVKNHPPYDQLPGKGRLRLMDDVFGVILNSRCWLLSATINLEKYFKKGYPYENPKAYAMLLMLERFQRFLRLNDSAGNAIYERFRSGDRRKIKRTISALANDVTAQSSTKHFTLAGIIVQDRVISTINTHVQNLIQQYFKSIPLDDKFKLHCYPLVKNHPPYDQLPGKGRLRLMDDVFGVILNSRCWLLSATINLEKYFKKGYPYENPKAYAMLLMLERFQRFLRLNDSAGNAIYERFRSGDRRKIKRTISALYGPLWIPHYADINDMLSNMQNGDPTNEPILQLVDFCAYATFTKHESDCRKQNRWEWIKQKYFGLDDGYYTSGNVYR